MLLGITLSNLSGDQKNLKAQKFFLTKFAECLGTSTRQKKHASALGDISTLLSASWRHSAIFHLCQGPAGGTRQRVDAVSPLTGGAWRARVLGTCSGFAECRPTSTRQRSHIAECLHSATPGHAVCQISAECPCPGTRQTTSLPSARGLALGKDRDTRQLSVFR